MKYSCSLVLLTLASLLQVGRTFSQTNAQPYALVDTIRGIAVYAYGQNGAIREIRSTHGTLELLKPCILTPGDSAFAHLPDGQEIKLYRTGLPLLSIETDTVIQTYPKISGQYTYQSPSEAIRRGFCGTELRGHTSLSYPKHTYDVELWTSDVGDDEADVSFAGLRTDGDWILDAAYNEPLRSRALVAHNLWVDSHELYYTDDKPGARSGARARHVELFENGDYKGVYVLMEQVDRKQLKIKKPRKGAMRGSLIRSVDYTTSTGFEEILSPRQGSFSLDGYEWKYPRDQADWTTFVRMAEALSAADSTNVYELASHYLEIENLVDYILFVNLLHAQDNVSKNVYWCRRDTAAPYFLAPWDLDAVWGNSFRGFPIVDTSGFRQNALIQKLMADPKNRFRQALTKRYFKLREDLWSSKALTSRMQAALKQLEITGAYSRERSRWPSRTAQLSTARDIWISFARARATWLDSFLLE